MTMTITGISEAVQEILEGVTSPEFVNVYPNPESKDTVFDGYPSATHFYQRTENGYATVTQNRRVIEYSVFVYLLLVGTTETERWLNGMSMVDKIVQVFDESVDLNGACEIMRPTIGEMGKVNTTAGEGLLVEITLYCEADTTFRNV